MANGVFAADQLRLFIERIERLIEEKKGIQDDIKDVFAEAKANGYHPATMRKCIALRKMETHLREEQDALLESYREALGMGFASTPLGAALSDFQESMADSSADKVTMKVGDGEEVTVFDRESHDKKKRGRPRKVRDPGDGSLVTVGGEDDGKRQPANGVDSTADAVAS